MIGDSIRILRLERGISVEQLAQALGISPKAIKYYENNIWRPGMKIAATIADYFGITLMELMNGFSLLYDETSGDMLLVRHMGGNRIRALKRVEIE